MNISPYERELTGSFILKEKIEKKKQLDNRSVNAKIYDEALVPKLPKYRIPERETVDASLTKDASTWGILKEHKRDIHDAIVPRNQSHHVLSKLSYQYTQNMQSQHQKLQESLEHMEKITSEIQNNSHNIAHSYFKKKHTGYLSYQPSFETHQMINQNMSVAKEINQRELLKGIKNVNFSFGSRNHSMTLDTYNRDDVLKQFSSHVNNNYNSLKSHRLSAQPPHSGAYVLQQDYNQVSSDTRFIQTQDEQETNFSKNSSLNQFQSSAIKIAPLRKVTRFVAQPPRPFKLNLETQKLQPHEDVYIDEDSQEEAVDFENAKSKSDLSLMQMLPNEKSRKLLSEASHQLNLQLMNMSSVEQTHFKSHKHVLVNSPSYMLDRSVNKEFEQQQEDVSVFKRRGLSMSAAKDFMINTQLPQIKEELENFDFVDKDKQKYLYKTRFLGGTSIYPKISLEERANKFTLNDPVFKEYKENFKDKLANLWSETIKLTMPYKFDPLTNKRGAPDNLPEPRNLGFRIGAIIARDQLFADEQNYQSRELLKKSQFRKYTPRGTKNSTMLLARAKDGGFYNPKTYRHDTKIMVEEVLYRQGLKSNIAEDKVLKIADDSISTNSVQENKQNKFSSVLEIATKEEGKIKRIQSNSPSRSYLAELRNEMGKTDFDKLSFAQRTIESKNEEEFRNIKEQMEEGSDKEYDISAGLMTSGRERSPFDVDRAPTAAQKKQLNQSSSPTLGKR